MAKANRSAFIIVLILLLAALLLLVRCQCQPTQPGAAGVPATDNVSPSTPVAVPVTTEKVVPQDAPPEKLTPATVTHPDSVLAGATFQVHWTGPNNPRDFVSIVADPVVDGSSYLTYADVEHGTPVTLTAPVQAGAYEVRYVASQSRTILARSPILITPAGATIDAVSTADLDTPVKITWKGPANKGDFVTIVPTATADNRWGHYADVEKGSPVTLNTPAEAGPAEIRYVTGQGYKVLARHPLVITTPETSVSADESAVAGKPVRVRYKGLNSPGDYITIVKPGVGDGIYGNYTDTAKGSPLEVTAPIEPGTYEIRYVGGQGKVVLAKKPLLVEAAPITLEIPATVKAGTKVDVRWSGPNNSGDYLTIVPQNTPEGRYAGYADVNDANQATIQSPAKAGPAELRYVSGQGAKTLARKTLEVTE